MKVIFLDVDGVLNNTQNIKKYRLFFRGKRRQNMYQKTGQRNLKSLEVHFSCQERVNFHMKIN